MDLKQLRTFYYVAKYGTLLKAANHLKLSSPAISMQLKKLERGLGVKLFDRHPSKLILTGHGSVVMNEASHVFDALTGLEEAVSIGPQIYTGRLTISLGTDLSKSFCTTHRRFQPKTPAVANHHFIKTVR